MRTLAVVLLVPALGACATEPPEADWPCTAIECVPGFQLLLRAGGEVLPDGHYVLAALVDGRDATIDLLVEDNLIACPVNRVDCQVEVPAGEGRHLLARLDSSNPAPESGLVNTELRVGYFYDPHPDGGAVEQLKLRVLLDGAEIAAAELAPEHVVRQPNGPGCGPGCLAAAAEVELDLTAIGGSPAGDGG